MPIFGVDRNFAQCNLLDECIYRVDNRKAFGQRRMVHLLEPFAVVGMMGLVFGDVLDEQDHHGRRQVAFIGNLFICYFFTVRHTG